MTTYATVNDLHSDRRTDADRADVRALQVVGWQECHHVNLSTALGATHGVHQVRELANPGKAGVAVTWRKDAVEALIAKGLDVGHPPVTGEMGGRFLAWVVLRIDGRVHVVVSGHRPPKDLSRLWPRFDTNLDACVDRLRAEYRPDVVVVLLDANQDPPTPLITRTGMRWFGVRIDGALVSGATVTNVRALPLGDSDHRPVAMTVTPKETPMPLISASPKKIIDVAASQVGVHEGRSDGHWNNDTRYADEVPGLEWADGQPWCATFVAWCALKAGLAALYPKTASCDVGGSWFKSRGRWSEYPAIGAQIFFGTPSDLSHTGIVIGYDATNVHTIEGNTNTTGAREGDGVYRMTHLRTSARVVGYGYPKFVEGIVSADPAYASQAPKAVTPSVPVAPAPAPVAPGPTPRWDQVVEHLRAARMLLAAIDKDFPATPAEAIHRQLASPYNATVAESTKY